MFEWIFKSGLASSMHRIDRFKIYDQYFDTQWQSIVRSSLDIVHVDEGQLCVDKIRSVRPDMILRLGASPLSGEVLSALTIPVINVHYGLLPFMNGSHLTAYAIIEHNIQNIGFTIYLEQQGMTDDPILVQKRPDIDPVDTPFTIDLKMTLLSIETIKEIIDHIKHHKGICVYPQNKCLGKMYHEKYWDKSIEHKLGLILKNGALGKLVLKHVREELPVCSLKIFERSSHEAVFKRGEYFPRPPFQ